MSTEAAVDPNSGAPSCPRGVAALFLDPPADEGLGTALPPGVVGVLGALLGPQGLGELSGVVCTLPPGLGFAIRPPAAGCGNDLVESAGDGRPPEVPPRRGDGEGGG